MLSQLRPAFVLLVLFAALTGLVYPLAVTGIAQAVFPHQANGSLIEKSGTVIGSGLIGQNFTDAKYFWPRPSATSDVDPADATKTVPSPYNAASSSGANKGPTSRDLLDRLEETVGRLRADAKETRVPVDLATASASGLDPHISPDAARFQIARVAKARNLPETQIASLIERSIEGRTFGLLGEPRVNVLQLNLALDAPPQR